jgi:hypothetical protein
MAESGDTCIGRWADPPDVGVVALHNKVVRIAASVVAAEMAHLVVVAIDLLSRVDRAFPLPPLRVSRMWERLTKWPAG